MVRPYRSPVVWGVLFLLLLRFAHGGAFATVWPDLSNVHEEWVASAGDTVFLGERPVVASSLSVRRPDGVVLGADSDVI